jgi:hypothetical protein
MNEIIWEIIGILAILGGLVVVGGINTYFQLCINYYSAISANVSNTMNSVFNKQMTGWGNQSDEISRCMFNHPQSTMKEFPYIYVTLFLALMLISTLAMNSAVNQIRERYGNNRGKGSGASQASSKEGTGNSKS